MYGMKNMHLTLWIPFLPPEHRKIRFSCASIRSEVAFPVINGATRHQFFPSELELRDFLPVTLQWRRLHLHLILHRNPVVAPAGVMEWQEGEEMLFVFLSQHSNLIYWFCVQKLFFYVLSQECVNSPSYFKGPFLNYSWSLFFWRIEKTDVFD